jgi:hypothetical protein
MIRQLLQNSDEATAHAYNTFFKDRKPPSPSELERLVGELFAIVSDGSPGSEPVWVVIDGVDECEADKLPRLVSLLTGRATGRARNAVSPAQNALCKVLFTSRRDPGFEKGTRGLSVVSLKAESIKDKVYAAIGSYVAHRLRSYQTSRRMYQLGLGMDELEDIKNDIVEKVDGKF